ncbi:Gfo/Idh/MocA family protein [Falsiroseomonas selenitidurans]|uniref:Gfo/Idh/MocA family oxidoreductase n=1 Tax=Falsiroseomonas selenitidurans TaxID=2716335 RepID=A0ABX1E2B5_9PROT|nr:Gfo/Idh/MocA family oxidoreductase [Falsiroseomonas selenitidurans]NKC31307.1 Gfo/Idh/MocA family oxidoreductase [Falsiroseomonas selenitidurans]
MSLRVAVLGAGHFGRFHALKAAKPGPLTLVALHDADPARAALVAGECGVPALPVAEAIAAAEAVIVAVPTRFHAALGRQVLEAGRHLFMEKPIAATLAEAEALAALAAARGRVLQVGHIERFSAAFRAVVAAQSGGAVHWEAVRVAPFRPRSLDVSVVLDLMIHDIDLVLRLAGEAPSAIEAVGARVMSDHADFAVARLRFPGGRAATITASRVSLAMERRLRVLGAEGEMNVDFLNRGLAVLRRGGAEPVATMPEHGIDRAGWTEHDSLEAEQAGFARACRGEAPPEVGAAEGIAALRVALAVEAAIG